MIGIFECPASSKIAEEGAGVKLHHFFIRQEFSPDSRVPVQRKEISYLHGTALDSPEALCHCPCLGALAALLDFLGRFAFQVCHQLSVRIPVNE